MTAQNESSDDETREVVVIISVTHTLEANQVWPDKNVPLDFTVDDVRREMEQYGRKRFTLSEWCLLDDLTVSVVVDGESVGVWDQ